jgi:hypothetical protein
MKNKLLFVVLLTCLFLGSIAFGNLAFSQDNQPHTERIFVHTDRDIYIAGESVFFQVTLTSTEVTENSRSSICYLVLRDAKSSIIKLMVRLESGKSFGSFYLSDTLKSGMYEMVAFTNYMRNFGESAYFRKNIMVANRFDKMLSGLFEIKSPSTATPATDSLPLLSLNQEEMPFHLSTEKDSFATREKIRIGIEVNTSLEKQFTGTVSISVKEMNPFARLQLLKLQNSGEFHPQDIASTRQVKITNSVEKNGVVLSGKFIGKDSVPLANGCLFLSTTDTIANLQYSFTDKDGNFAFFLDSYYHGKQLIIKSSDNKPENSDAKIIIDNKFTVRTPFHPDLPEFSGEMRKYIFSSQNLVQIQKMYGTKDAINSDRIAQNQMIPVLYNHPTSICYPAEFVALKNLDEICANILPGVKLKKDKNRYDLYVYNYLTDQFFDSPAIVFVDGVPIDNVNQLLSLGSPDIYKVEVCKIPRVKGNIEFPGIVSVITTKKKFNSLAFSSSMLRYSTENFTPKTDFNSPVYSKKSSSNPTPDFRQLLYWNPSVELKTNGITYVEFNASDWFSDYLIEVSGISKDGKPLVAYRKIKIYR